MQITKQQLSDIESALYLAEYFCDEHSSGFSCQEQNKEDWQTYHDAIEAIKQIKANHANNS